jgi:hypothetical protein
MPFPISERCDLSGEDAPDTRVILRVGSGQVVPPGWALLSTELLTIVHEFSDKQFGSGHILLIQSRNLGDIAMRVLEVGSCAGCGHLSY